ncbi:MAG: hypothetical protein A3E84_02720 [Gammaproteobacteria bacterium RIFCSPHIGHO2_12_FULL_42_13]|nr:MAG: hypothetical protein A3E84_02720 [Gammaproteobacteria bacterium RIFCSPHIGHO2_12_FULL_42_13]
MDALSVAIISIAHLLIGCYFVFFGFWNVYHWRPILTVMSQKNIPHPYLILPIGIAWQVVCGSMIALGVYVKLAALLLIPFTFVAICLFHSFWEFKGDIRTLNFTIFVANMTVTIPALLLLIAPLSGIADFFLI